MAEHCASTADWTDLPSDLLARILQLLQLPEALAVAAVCTSWRSVAAAAGDPRARIPWLVSWEPTTGYCRSSEFRNLLDTHKTYKVSLPEGRRHLDWCGSSHGWLVASNEYSNLVLYHPFTFDIIPLPPITDLECVKAVHDSDGNIVGYRYGNDHEHEPTQHAVHSLGTWFYQKVVLSCDPSQDGDYVAVTIHYDANCVLTTTTDVAASVLSSSSRPPGRVVLPARGRVHTLARTASGALRRATTTPASPPHVPSLVVGVEDGRVTSDAPTYPPSGFVDGGTPGGCARVQDQAAPPASAVPLPAEAAASKQRTLALAAAAAGRYASAAASGAAERHRLTSEAATAQRQAMAEAGEVADLLPP
ncbi:hypothetical protein ACQ4PT_046920 [Festuca glaucescens]